MHMLIRAAADQTPQDETSINKAMTTKGKGFLLVRLEKKRRLIRPVRMVVMGGL